MTESPVARGVRVDRDQALADTFVLLADTLVADYDVLDLLDQLMSASVDLIGVTAAGLLLDDQRGNLQVVASSSEETRLLEIFQLQTNQGPCLECVRTGAPVTSQDISAETQRWPLFAPRAGEVGFRSVAALPMRLRDDVVGALNLFQAGDEPIDPHQRRLGQAFADVATIGILQRRTVHRSALLAEQLQFALNSRVVIEQAKGIVAERRTTTMAAAFDLLRRYARDHNLKLTDTAMAVIDGTVDPGGLSH
jgi:transcriptional regulator with GAF, ATPase, and Fis domain